MPIHHTILNPRQAEAGKIKIGHLGETRKGKAGRDYQLPVKIDHFLITKIERGDDGNFELDEKLMEVLPKDPDGKIRKIPILLSSDDIDEIFPHTLACYSGRNLFCSGDGYGKATRFELKKEIREGQKVTVRTGRSKKVTCTCSYYQAETGLQCKPHATLWVTIVAGEHTQIGARHSFRTTSWESIASLIAGLKEIQRLVGTLVGVPITMHVRPRVKRPKGSDKSTTVYIVHVTCSRHDIQKLREEVLAQAQMRQSVAASAGPPVRSGLPAPGVAESPAEQARIQQEYHPDAAPDEDDDGDYDPVSGEVFDTDVPDEGGWTDNPKPEDESQEEEPPDDEKIALAEADPVRRRVKELLTKIAEARDVPEDELKSARAGIWREATEKAGYPRLPWTDLTIFRTRAIEPALQNMLRRYNEDAEI